MYNEIQLFFSWPFLLLLSLPVTTIGPTALPTENKTQSLENNGTDLNSKNSSSLTTIAPTLINNQSSAPLFTKVTQGHKSTREHIRYITGGTGDDYYEDDNEETIPPIPPNIILEPCPYDRCKHLETPCEETQRRAQGRCLCPGINGPTIRPSRPHLTQIIPGERYINMSWCSPLSTVHGYKVLYGPPTGLLERGPVLNDSFRFCIIEGLLPNTPYRVCILAFNDAGESPVEEGNLELDSETTVSCRFIHTTSSKELYIYVGVGLAALAGLVGLVVLGYCLYKKRKSNKETNWEDMVLPDQLYRGHSVEQL
ncbi:LRRN4 C-terminal [Pelobates cultripes]|uniref:LRRN4 C-terminal n=1 Tax=Pelobates cultripes TaxID=61616 RepID=A0AAD1TJB1_PELCU|nr:LRRN4 C-terminal [Pelobates cultripes]